jgi:hypothetical protein
MTSKPFWPHDLILGLLPLILVVQAAMWCLFLPQVGLRGVADFRQLYAGGYMVRTGHARELCDYDAQKRFEDALVPVHIDFMLPISHLPFEALLFVPLSLFSYRTAYWFFLAMNGTLLAVCLWLLKPNMQVLSNRWRWFPALLFAAFYPISRAMVEGQDSIIMLTLLAGALWSLDHDKDLTAGLLIGMGLFKFQIVIPIALLFLMWRCWRVFGGFAISSLTAALISLGLVGLHGAREYADTLLGMSVRLSSRADMLRYGTIPMAMLNLRGLASALLGGTLSQSGIQFVILACSMVVLAVAARRRSSLQLAILASSLVSYHLLCHDASILIIPVAAALCSQSVWRGAVAALLLVVPFSSVVPQYGYVAAIPLLALFVLSVGSARKGADACQVQAN